MTSITVGSEPFGPSATTSLKAPVPTDPVAFAAELRSAIDSGTAAPVPGLPIDASTVAPLDATSATTLALPAIDPVAPAAAPSSTVEPGVDPVVPALTASEPVAADAAVPTPPPAPAAPVSTDVLTGPISAHRGRRHVADSDGAPVPSAAASFGYPLTGPLPTVPAPASLPAATTLAPHTLDVAVAVVSAGNTPPAGKTPLGAVPTAVAHDVETNPVQPNAPVQVAPALPPQITVLPGRLTVFAPPTASAAVSNIQHPGARIVASSTTATRQDFAVALAQPAFSTVTASNVPSVSGVPQAATPLNEQLALPLLALRTAGAGTHVLTLTVSPDSIGPVTVRAHVSGDTLRIELSAPTAQGTDALKSMLTDLKRDLSQGGATSALSVASSNSDGSVGNQGAFAGSGGSFTRDERPSYLRQSPTAPSPAPVGPAGARSVAATSVLDVFA